MVTRASVEDATGCYSVAARATPSRADEAAAESQLDAPWIAHTEAGYIVTGADGDFEARATDLEALADLETTAWFKDALGTKTLISDLGEPRWIDAAAEEDIPTYLDGSQVREALIDQMVENFFPQEKPLVIDGGNISGVHENPKNGAAKAAGWGYVACKVLDEEGRAHLYLYGALIPEVEEQVQSKQLLFGSVAFVSKGVDRYTGEPVGAVLVSYSLTNEPFIHGLKPHARTRSVASGRIAHTRSRPAMPTKTTRTDATKNKPTVRGPMADALKSLALKCGLEVNADTDLTSLSWQINDTVNALAQAAKSENLAEFAASLMTDAPAGDAAPESGEKSVRAVEGLEDAALETFTADVIKELRRVTGVADGAPAALLEALKAMPEASAADETKEENAGEGGTEVKSVRSREQALESAGLRSAFNALTAKVETLEAEKRGRDIEELLDKSWRDAKLEPPTGEERAVIVEHARSFGENYPKAVALTLRAVNRPPQGTVAAPAPGTTTVKGEPTTADEALAAMRAELKAKDPKISGVELRSKAAEQATVRWKHLFRRSA